MHLPDIFFFAVVFLYVVINTVDFFVIFLPKLLFYLYILMSEDSFSISQKDFTAYFAKKKKLTTFSLHIHAKLIKRLFVLKGIL